MRTHPAGIAKRSKAYCTSPLLRRPLKDAEKYLLRQVVSPTDRNRLDLHKLSLSDQNSLFALRHVSEKIARLLPKSVINCGKGPCEPLIS